MAGNALRHQSSSADACLSGGGEMGALMRSMDWSRSPLGPVEGWPQDLRTSVSTCLNSRFAILIWWGRDLIMLYNDAYREIIAAKHPAALGQPGRDCWPEIWHIIGPMLGGVMERGDATRSDDLLLLLERNGYPEECYFTFSYSPICDVSGTVVGVFTPVAETTDKVIGARRLCTLRDLASRGSIVKTPDEACRTAAETLLGNPYDVPFAALYLYNKDRSRAVLAATAGVDRSSPISPETIAFDSPDPGRLARCAATSRIEEIGDLASLGLMPRGAWSVSTDSAFVLPLVSPGQPQPSGFLVAGINPCKRPDESYRTFFELAAGNIATAIAEAEAYEHERRRAEGLALLNRAKTAFFSNVSHEFRTPLTLMLGPLEDLLAGSLPEPARQDLELIHRNALRLLKLVNNLLDFSRIEAGRVDARYVPVDLASLTTDLASVFRSAIEKAGLSFSIDCPPLAEPIYVDREMWEKIVLNLLSNAFKFTFQGEIAVSLRPAGQYVELSVRDTGIGIQPGDVPRIFDRFHRIEGAHGRIHEGSGIGLALVQELTRLNGGTVRVESVYGQGSVFTVSIPTGCAHLPPERISQPGSPTTPALAAAPYLSEAVHSLPSSVEPVPFLEAGWLPESDLSPETDLSAGVRRPRILLADDHSDLRDYVRRLLLTRYEVEVVSNGEEALRAIAKHTPDLLVSDVMMPRLDGFGLLAAIRRNPELASLPVILLSARAGEEARVEGLQAGADDYLTKPFSARELLARIASHLAISTLRREAAERERALRLEADAERVRWRGLLRQAPAAIAVVSGPDHVFEIVNEAYVRAAGRPEASLVGVPIRDALPEIAGQGIVELLDDVYRQGRPVFGDERLVKLDAHGAGTLQDHYFNFTFQPSRSSDGHIEGILILAVDVTEQVLARRRVEESEEQFRTLANSIPQLAWMARSDGSRFWFNRRWYEYTGRSAQEMAGWGWQKVHHPDHAARVFERLRQCFEEGSLWEDIFPLRGKDGDYRWFLSRAIALRDSAGKVTRWFGTNTDITEQRETEARLREAQTFESLGILAGGIAHDFNNILTGVLGNASLVAEMLPAQAPAAPLVREIETAAERAAHLTRQMLAYAGRAQFVIEPVDISDVVRQTAELLRPSLSKRISLYLDLDPHLPAIEADSGEIQQVITNLVLNAAEAVADHAGVIAVKTCLLELMEGDILRTVAMGGLEPGRYVCLEVRDTGCGMDDDTRARIFEPFFSTKFTGRGLGLAAVAGIVRGHRGAIRVDSAVGRGSTFEVLFPAAVVPEAAPAVPEPVVPARATATVLIVDDEEVVLRTAKLALQRYGYQVLLASSGPAALELLERDPAAVDLVLLDLSMPGMDGRETLEAIHRIRPGIKAIISSGYSEAETLRRFSGQPVAGFVQKPYGAAVLARTVQEVLARS